ncbi:unnamed protein product [Allacma fusca]|uniref:Uncharacterized protein n=1 Tax=Allacma fusca TaxID=39272 RepID=A0A8J2PRB6_9HEXA|nr:unnamed protein product [Allacma fusca]
MHKLYFLCTKCSPEEVPSRIPPSAASSWGEQLRKLLLLLIKQLHATSAQFSPIVKPHSQWAFQVPGWATSYTHVCIYASCYGSLGKASPYVYPMKGSVSSDVLYDITISNIGWGDEILWEQN